MSERTEQKSLPDGTSVDFDAFDRMTCELGLTDDQLRAAALDMDVSGLSRMRGGKAQPGNRFIARTVFGLGIPFAAVFRPREHEVAR